MRRAFFFAFAMTMGLQVQARADETALTKSQLYVCDTLELNHLNEDANEAGRHGDDELEKLFELAYRATHRRACRFFEPHQAVVIEDRMPANQVVCIKSADKADIRFDEKFCYWAGVDMVEVTGKVPKDAATLALEAAGHAKGAD